MEIKKPSAVTTVIQRNNSDETEKKPEKTTAVGISNVKDAFEVAGSNNGGLLSESRFIHQAKENLGKKELSPEQEQRVSDFATKDLQRPTSFVQTSESKGKESENSGLAAPFTRPKSPEEELKEKVAEDKKKIKDFTRGNTLGNDTGNPNVNQLVDGSNLRDTLKNEIAERHEEVNVVSEGKGGTGKERLQNVMKGMDGGEAPKNAPTYGKDMISAPSLGIDPTPAEVQEAIRKREERENQKQDPAPKPKDDSIIPSWGDVKKFFGIDEKDEQEIAEGGLELAEELGPGIPAPPLNKDQYESTGIGLGTVLSGKDRNPVKETQKGGTLKDSDYENYNGGTPDAIKKHLDYLQGQYRKAHQDPGGNQIQEDPNAVKGGGQVNDANVHVFELGNTGLVGQPDTTREAGSIGNSTQPGGASGGDIDWGPDSNQIGFNGTPHQDDPGDIQFGPSGQPEQLADTEEEEEQNKKTPHDFIRTIR
jgi:hypothetical protein